MTSVPVTFDPNGSVTYFQRQQKNISQMYLGQSDASQKLLKTSENNDKLRLENKKKTEQIEKMQKEMRSMEDRIRNLEIRGTKGSIHSLLCACIENNMTTLSWSHLGLGKCPS